MNKSNLLFRAVALCSVISFIGLFLVFSDYLHPPVYDHERNTSIPFLLAAALAIIGNFRIIHYHATVPPHPKFMMMKDRKFWIRVHAISGSLEVVLGIVAWFTMDADLAIATALIALLFHGPSAFFHAPGVFGTKGIMVPAYFAVVTLHMYCAFRLLMEGGDIYWLERTWMALQAYAYVRIYGFLINYTNSFRDSIYTVSVLMAGATITPFILGPAGPLCILIVVLIYLGFYKLIKRPSQEEWAELFVERERRSLMDDEMRNLWMARHVNTSGSKSSMENARLVFDQLDKNKSGKISLGEIQELMKSWGATERLIHSFIRHHDQKDGIDFHTFVTSIWISGRIQEHLIDSAAPHIKDPEQQARFIFNHLDMDSSGFLEPAEIELLLLEWGVDSQEAQRYMEQYSGNDKKIDFEEFHIRMKAIWKFGFSEVYG